jgi:hypothetical protein
MDIYFHELTNREKKDILLNLKFSYILENYKQPEWCNKDQALNGIFGCNILLGLTHNKINKEFCSNCKNFKL